VDCALGGLDRSSVVSSGAGVDFVFELRQAHGMMGRSFKGSFRLTHLGRESGMDPFESVFSHLLR
jgi:hypothetical protein